MEPSVSRTFAIWEICGSFCESSVNGFLRYHILTTCSAMEDTCCKLFRYGNATLMGLSVKHLENALPSTVVALLQVKLNKEMPFARKL
ncbi:hypothetical protein NPIL_188041 [Nephila pilipes]|uniref:Uncharacterized protein n=1 Tax=Nephila pilipes TaxID=299642 RepID=A0A8X6Q6K6_NEPPI|nr:hypothetical protein NPIL_188041 [Nephila pilipes]